MTPAPAPTSRRAPDLAAVIGAAAAATDLESLTRPLLDALHDVSGIASTYLTVVDEQAGDQLVRFAHNTKEGFSLPEGLHVPWEDTLCKRALDEGRSCTTDVPLVWGDSGAAADLGIVTYVSVPVRLSDGRLWGTLCGADDVAHDDAAEHLTTLHLFATLIAAEVERGVPAAPAPPTPEPETDLLTGCAARRTVQPWVDAAYAARRRDEVVVLVQVDVDHFGRVNDALGHAAGDALLGELGRRLAGVAGAGDLVARLGGDDLVLGSVLPHREVPGLVAKVRAAGRFALARPGGAVQVRCATGLATSADSPADALLAAAGTATGQDKPLRP